MMLSPRAIQAYTSRSTPIPIYYGNLNNWLPIMRAYEAQTPSYFATPPVNAIRALYVSCNTILAQTIQQRAKQHARVASAFHVAITQGLHLSLLTAVGCRAHTLSAIKFPLNVESSKWPSIVPHMAQQGVVASGGLHKDVKTQYFRIGHMNISVLDLARGDMVRVLSALESALVSVGMQGIVQGEAVKLFEQALNA